MLSTLRFNWCWTLQITVHLSSKDLGMLALLLLWNWLPCGFDIDTRLAEERIPRQCHFQMYACHHSIINKLLHNLEQDVAHTAVKLVQCKCICCCYIHLFKLMFMLNIIQSALVLWDFLYSITIWPLDKTPPI